MTMKSDSVKKQNKSEVMYYIYMNWLTYLLTCSCVCEQGQKTMKIKTGENENGEPENLAYFFSLKAKNNSNETEKVVHLQLSFNYKSGELFSSNMLPQC